MNVKDWEPSAPQESRLWSFMQFASKKHQKSFTEYQHLYGWSIAEPSAFWETLSEFFNIKWASPPASILSTYSHMLDAVWFQGASLNIAQILLSRQDEHLALIAYDENGKRQAFTYRALYEAVAQCAAGMIQAGIKAQDHIAAVLPNVPYAIIAMLATASIGAVWSSCAAEFGAKAIIDRFSQIAPKLLFIGDGHRYQGKTHDATSTIQAVINALPSLTTTVVCPIIQQKMDLSSTFLTWEAFLKPASLCSFAPMPFAHPLYVLFSSGTTGKPKCIVHGAGGTLLQHLKELGLHTDLKPSDNLFFYTTCGWMMWNWMVSALALGCTLTLYDGAPNFPDIYHLFRIIDKEKVSVFGTSAKFISMLEKEGAFPSEHAALSSLRTILSTGSPLLPKNYDYVYQKIKKTLQLSSISGGTDIISCFALGNPLLPVYRGELQCLGLGMAVEIYNENGEPVLKERGELVCTLPFPSMPIYFLNDPDKKRYYETYFKRFKTVWAHGDFAEITAHQGLIIYGRSDTLLNPGGVRIGTAEIYRHLEQLPEITESIAIGQDWQDDTRIVLFVVLKDDLELTATLVDKIKKTLKTQASPRHVPAKILKVPQIPKTFNGKITELAVRQVVHQQPVSNLHAIANPESLRWFQNREELKH